jgi:predicted RNase H-like nuclease
VLPDISAVLDNFPTALIAIDVPIGLPDRGKRACDVAARQLLGSRGCTVFSAPIRPMLRAKTYTEACLIGRETDGRALSRQCWGIVPKVREVDVAVTTETQERVIEVHPEVSFCAMNRMRPVMTKKSARDGQTERLGLLGASFDLTSLVRPLRAKADDLADALAALWSGLRFVRGEARRVTDTEETDGHGLRMQIHY